MLDPWVKIKSHMKHGANYEPCYAEDLFMVTLWCETGEGRCGIHGKGVAEFLETRNTDKPSPLLASSLRSPSLRWGVTLKRTNDYL